MSESERATVVSQGSRFGWRLETAFVGLATAFAVAFSIDRLEHASLPWQVASFGKELARDPLAPLAITWFAGVASAFLRARALREARGQGRARRGGRRLHEERTEGEERRLG